jgi:hypothetical protein
MLNSASLRRGSCPGEALRGKTYTYLVAVTTDNAAGARGTSNAYGFEVRGDRWLISRGPELAGVREEIWKRAN